MGKYFRGFWVSIKKNKSFVVIAFIIGLAIGFSFSFGLSHQYSVSATWKSSITLIAQISIPTLSLLAVFATFYRNFIMNREKILSDLLLKEDFIGKKNSVLETENPQFHIISGIEKMETHLLDYENELKKSNIENKDKLLTNLTDARGILNSRKIEISNACRLVKSLNQHSNELMGDSREFRLRVLFKFPIILISFVAISSLFILTLSSFNMGLIHIIPNGENIFQGLVLSILSLFLVSIATFSLFFISFVSQIPIEGEFTRLIKSNIEDMNIDLNNWGVWGPKGSDIDKKYIGLIKEIDDLLEGEKKERVMENN